MKHSTLSPVTAALSPAPLFSPCTLELIRQQEQENSLQTNDLQDYYSKQNVLFLCLTLEPVEKIKDRCKGSNNKFLVFFFFLFGTSPSVDKH